MVTIGLAAKGQVVVRNIAGILPAESNRLCFDDVKVMAAKRLSKPT